VSFRFPWWNSRNSFVSNSKIIKFSILRFSTAVTRPLSLMVSMKLCSTKWKNFFKLPNYTNFRFSEHLSLLTRNISSANTWFCSTWSIRTNSTNVLNIPENSQKDETIEENLKIIVKLFAVGGPGLTQITPFWEHITVFAFPFFQYCSWTFNRFVITCFSISLKQCEIPWSLTDHVEQKIPKFWKYLLQTPETSRHFLGFRNF